MGKVLRFGGAPGHQDDADENWMFDGLEGLAIVIEDLDPVASEAGLNRTNLQLQIEERLSEMGIPLAPLIAVTNDHPVAVLCVAIDADRHSTGPVACSLRLQVCEAAALVRNPEMGGGVVTWQTNDSWVSSFEDVQRETMAALHEGLASLGESFHAGQHA